MIALHTTTLNVPQHKNGPTQRLKIVLKKRATLRSYQADTVAPTSRAQMTSCSVIPHASEYASITTIVRRALVHFFCADNLLHDMSTACAPNVSSNPAWKRKEPTTDFK